MSWVQTGVNIFLVNKFFRLKSIIAYSSITHIGWTLSPIVIHTPCISIIYFTVYIIITALIIFIPIILFSPISSKQINTILSSNFWYTATLRLLLLSLRGLAPLTGFIPKLLAISYLIKSNKIILILLLLGSLIVYWLSKHCI